ncbi:MAG: hypothetical protein M9894_11610 [Planctomycetes bacterium]|nr:hypothetical protein [Planctomycetota bacterium]
MAAPDLAAEVAGAVARRRGPDLAADAARFLRAAPAAQPGPAASEALAGLYEPPLEAFAADPGARGSFDLLVAGLRAEAALAGALERAGPPPDSVARAVRAVMHYEGLAEVHPDAVAHVVVASLRAGVLRPARDLARRAPLDSLERLAAACPRSRAAATCLLLAGTLREVSGAATVEPARDDALLAALDAGVDDLAPAYADEVRVRVAYNRIKALARAAPVAGRDEALGAALALLARGRAGAPPFDYMLADAAEVEALGLEALGEHEAAIKAWRDAIASFRARVDDPAAVPVPALRAEDDKFQGACARALALLLERLGRPEEAEAALREALAFHAHALGSSNKTAAQLSALLRRRGAAAAAWEALAPFLTPACLADHDDLPVEAVQVLLALGRDDEARDLHARALERHRGSERLRRLAERLR